MRECGAEHMPVLAVEVSLSSLCRAVLNYVAHSEFGEQDNANWDAQNEYNLEVLEGAARTWQFERGLLPGGNIAWEADLSRICVDGRWYEPVERERS